MFGGWYIAHTLILGITKTITTILKFVSPVTKCNMKTIIIATTEDLELLSPGITKKIYSRIQQVRNRFFLTTSYAHVDVIYRPLIEHVVNNGYFFIEDVPHEKESIEEKIHKTKKKDTRIM